MQGKRIVFTGVRKAEWETFDVPARPGPHEIIIRSKFSLISPGTELAIYTGSHIGFSLPKPPFPLIPNRPGYALAGNVTAAGEAVQGIPAGTRVMAEAPHGTYGIVDTRREPVTILPAGVSDDTAPLIRMAKIGMTALRLAPPTLGESVLVFGLGLVGLFAGRLFRLSGARPVIGTDLVEFRLDKAWEAGLIPLHGRDPDLAGKIKTLTGGRGADIVVEATGSPGVILSALESAADGGRVVLLGSPRGKVELDPYSLIHRKGVSVIGSHERMQSMEGSGPSRWDRKKNQEVLAALFASGDILTAGYVTDVIAPKDVPAMYETLAASPEKTLGVLIDWSRGLE